jgi:hypothetical protein
MLKFGKANAKLRGLEVKLNKKVYQFDLLSGHSCPFAKECFAKVNIVKGRRKVIDGPNMQFRCYSASQEALFGNVYNARKYNFDLVKSVIGKPDELVKLIQSSIPKNAGIIRIHSAGDFFIQSYFDAWMKVAINNPHILFYAYTKALPFWVKRIGSIPKNVQFTASYGGKRDDLIAANNLRSATVLHSVAQARRLKLKIDKNDILAATSGPSFALLVHGPQAAGSIWGKSVRKLKGKGSYGKKSLSKAGGVI